MHGTINSYITMIPTAKDILICTWIWFFFSKYNQN